MSSPSIVAALRAYAEAINTLELAPLVPWLADDFAYESQNVFTAITSKAEFLPYMEGKLATIAQHPAARVWAEMGLLNSGSTRPCVLLAQGAPDKLVGLVLATMSGDRLQRLDLCTVAPHPAQALRSGEYPGLAVQPPRFRP